MRKYRDYFSDYIFSIFIREDIFKGSYLFEEEGVKDESPILYSLIEGEYFAEIDELYYKILKLIVDNTRMPTLDIANALKTTASTVRNSIKRMIESNIIQGFYGHTDTSKIGYNWYKIFITLKEYNKSEAIKKYIRKNPYF